MSYLVANPKARFSRDVAHLIKVPAALHINKLGIFCLHNDVTHEETK